MARKFAIGSKKGGPGKTTMTCHLADSFQRRGARVLVVDLDSQASTTSTLRADSDDTEDKLDLFDVLYSGEPGVLSQAIVTSSWDGIDLIPGSESLARIDSEALLSPEMRLKSAAYGDAGLDVYDIVLLDLPPAVGRLTLNGLIFADYAVAVAEPTSFGLTGVMQFLETVHKVKSLPHLNPEIQLAGIVVNKVENTLEHEAGIRDLVAAYGEAVLKPYVQARTAVQQSESRQVPLTALKTESAKQVAFRFDRLAQNLDERTRA